MTLSQRIAATLFCFGAVSPLAAAEIDSAALLERLERLERRLEQVEAENQRLREQLDAGGQRVERVEQRVARAVQPGVAPTQAPSDDFSFKTRGVLNADAAAFHARAGGYDYNSGSALRRARLGFEGTAWRDFKWRIEADFSGNQVALQDAYVQFAGVKPWAFTFGQHKAPYGLEANNSDNNNVFLERGMFTNAFGNAGAERRIGASAFYGTDRLTFGIGVFGDNESSQRVAASPDESIGANTRITWAPLFEPGHALQLGAAGYYRSELREGGVAHAVRFADRPGVRVDGGAFADTGVIRDADALRYLGGEAVYVRGPLTLAGEYGRAHVARRSGLDTLEFDGSYVFGSWFLTGETRPLKAGNFDRIKPHADFDWQKGSYGAFELALRYDRFDFAETPVAAAQGNQGHTRTFGLNWYLNPNLKLMFNWLRIHGERSPLDPLGNRARADVAAVRAHLDW